ncbi:HET-domain-containing protein, partial [Periconia macrospinosa]
MPKKQKLSHEPAKTLTLDTQITNAYLDDQYSPGIFCSDDEGEIGPRELLPYVPYVEKTIDTSSYAWTQKDFRPAETVKNWLQTCDKQHRNRGGCSIGPHATDSPWSRPLLLIDVVKGCLVHTPPDAAYVALSYTWGKNSSSSTCTLKENIARFKETGGLIASEETLPKTVKDAVEFVEQIGLRYLWVDRFCIVQDETVAKQSQLDAMGKIYAGSYLTIIAAESNDASGPLYIANNRSKRVDYDSQIGKSNPSGTDILVHHTCRLMLTAWYSRAWTLQEYLFSKRKVVFQDGTVNWECGISAWHETQQVSMETVPELKSEHNHARASSIAHLKDDSTGLDFPSWPDMSRYARLVSLFNVRELSFPEDVLDAFAGFLSHLSRVFPGGIISGIPAMCFDAALLWQPYRAMDRRKPIKMSASDAVLPSWSWAGWAGTLNSESWRSAANYLFEGEETYLSPQTTWKTISTVEWSYSISL